MKRLTFITVTLLLLNIAYANEDNLSLNNTNTKHIKTTKSLLVSKERLQAKNIQSYDEYFQFLSKFGWSQALYQATFDRKSFDNCLSNDTVETLKLKYKGRKGIVDGWLVKPKEKSSDKLPLVIYNRDGAAKYGRLLLIEMFYFCQLAERRYALMASDFRESSSPQLEKLGLDKQLDVTDLGYGDVFDSIDLITLANEFNSIDTNNIALWGVSRGTMINALMLTKLNNIKATIMVGAVSHSDDDFRKEEFNKHVYPLIVEGWNSLAKEKQTELLRGISPLYLIKDIESEPAFLFLHGSKDKRTPLFSNVRLC